MSNGALITGIMASRMLFGMAGEGVLPSVLRRTLSERRTPWVAILVAGLVTAVLAATGDVAETAVLLLVLAFIAVNASVLALRRRPEVGERDHFRAPLMVPALGILGCLALLTQQTGATVGRAGALLALGLVGFPLARALARRAGRTNVCSPVPPGTTPP